tara:strand:- start:10244 stop:12340 length:2097 start_codon:yes stop_codon:yes gene_type:complete
MVDFVGFGTGYNKQMNSDERRRLELAKAFNEFRQSNPYASPMEMQSFVDQAAAGRNYLAGGMPSADVLNIIGKRNAEALQAKKDADARAAATNKLNLFNTQLNMGDALARGFTGEIFTEDEEANRIFTDEYKNYLKDIEEQSGVDFSEILTPDRIRKVREDRTISLVPKVVDYIRTTDGEVNVEDAAKALGVPKFLINSVVQRVKTQLSRESADYLYNKKKDLLAQIRPIMEEGRDVNEAFEAFKTDAINFGIDQSEVNKVLAEMKKESDRIRKKIDEDRLYDKNKRVQEVKIAFANDVQQVPQVKVAIARGDINAAKEFMEEYLLNNYTTLSDDEKTAIKETFNSIVKGLTIEAQYNQDTLHNEKKSKADIAVAGVPAAVLKKSQDSAFTFFTGGEKNKINPATSGEATAAPAVAAELAKKYDLSNSYTLSLLSDYFKRVGKDEGNDYNALLAGANAILENTRGVTTIEQATEYTQDLTRKQLGDFDGDQTFENWFTNEKTQYNKKFEEAKAALTSALQETDATAKLRALRGVAAGLNQLQQVTAESFRTAFRYAQGKDRWITAGTPGWNRTTVEGWQNGINTEKDALMKQITEQIAIAERQVQNTPTSPTLVDNITSQEKTLRDSNIPTVIARQQGQRQKMVKQFMDIRNIKRDIINKLDSSQYQEFQQDPVSFIKRYYNTYYSQWITQNNNGDDL